MKLRTELGALVVPLALLAGCNDPVVGTWQSADAFCENGQRDSLEIDSDLSGTGSIVVGCDGSDGPALVCQATIQMAERYQRDGSWDLQADFGYCPAVEADLGRGYKLCQERSAETELYCCDSDGSHCLLYTQISD